MHTHIFRRPSVLKMEEAQKKSSLIIMFIISYFIFSCAKSEENELKKDQFIKSITSGYCVKFIIANLDQTAMAM